MVTLTISYKYRTWRELMQARDSFQLLCDLGFLEESKCSEYEQVLEEIHRRYLRKTTKGGE